MYSFGFLFDESIKLPNFPFFILFVRFLPLYYIICGL
nr:MAG TPA: hypothetical protein [Caudoviricetes sp.]